MKTSIGLMVLVLQVGCSAHRNAMMIKDDRLNPIGAQNQLELGPSRGTVGHRWYPPDSDEPMEYFRLMGSGKKSWVLANWGEPDEVSRIEGTEYLVCTKRSKQAPKYAFQKDGYVKLAYRRDQLVLIEAFCHKMSSTHDWTDLCFAEVT